MDKIDIVLDFARQTDELINAVVDKHPNDGVILNFAMKIAAAYKNDPSIIIEGAGPFIFNERELITKGMEYIHLIDTNAALDSKKDKINNKEMKSFVYVIDLIKKDWDNMKAKEKENIYNNITSLLNIYIKYLLALQ